MSGGGGSPRRSGTGANHHSSAWTQQASQHSGLAKSYEPYRFSLSLDSPAAAAAAAHSLQPPQHQLVPTGTWAAGGHANASSRPHTADAVTQGGLVGAYPLVLPHQEHSHQPTFYSPPPPPPAPLPWHVRSNSLPKYCYGDMAANQTFNGEDLAGAAAGGKHSPIKASPPPPVAKEDYSADYTAEDYAHFSPSRRQQQQQQHLGNGADDDDDDGNGNGQFQRHGMFTPLEEGRDSFGDGGALYGSHIYEPQQQQQQQQQRAVDDLNSTAYRRFSTPSLGYPASAGGGGDGGMDSRASNRPFRWSADFTQYDNAGGSFAPPAPPQHPLYQPQYLQSANPYHQPVSYAHGGTYQHPAYSRPSTADGQQQQQQQHYLQQQQQQQAPATYTLPVQRQQQQQQPAPPLISFAPPPPPGAADTGGPPSLSLDTSHNALSAAAKFVSPPSATTSLPPQRPVQGQSQNRTGGGPASASPWSGPPPPLSLSLGVSASSLAARRRNTTDFTTLSQSLPASGANGSGDASSGRPGGDRTRVASADGTTSYSLGNGGPGGKPLSATTTSSSHLSATGSSGPTSATSAHPSGTHSGASSAGGVPTLSSIKEPRPSSPRSEAVDGGDEDAEGEQDVEEPAASAEGDELDEDEGDDEEEARDDTDGEYRPGGGGSNGANASSSSKRRAGARQSEGAGTAGGGSRKRGGRAGAGGASGLERRATTAGSSASQGERPAKRRKSEADGELEKKFTCPHPSCGRAFARNFNLQAHIKSHQGIREFKCPECFKLFSRKHDCTRHCISIHNYDKDGTAPPERQPVYVAQKVLPVNVMVERAQERQRAAVGSGEQSNSDDYSPRSSTAAPLFSGRPLAVKRDGTDERSPLLSHAPFVPPHPAYGSQYRAGQDDGRDLYGGYASTSTEQQQQQQLPPQAAPPPSLSFDHPSIQPAAGAGQQQPQQQQHQPQE